jgi:Plasmid pRiA4b ORF-3-like protein
MDDNDNVLELFAENPLLDDRKPRLYRLSCTGHRIVYRYDFGDDWCHDVHVEDLVRIEHQTTARRGPSLVSGHARRKT